VNHNRPGGPIEVPMAEDNPDDVSLTQEALEGPRLCINVAWSRTARKRWPSGRVVKADSVTAESDGWSDQASSR